jgi:hypothetical protein
MVQVLFKLSNLALFGFVLTDILDRLLIFSEIVVTAAISALEGTLSFGTSVHWYFVTISVLESTLGLSLFQIHSWCVVQIQ